MSNKRLFLKGISASYVFIVFSLLTSLLLVPFILKYLTDPEYAVFVIVGDLIAWAGATNLGINATFNSKAAQVIGKKDFQELNVLYSTTFFGHLLSSLLIIILSIFIFINPEFFFTNIKEGSIELVVIILLGSFYVGYITQPLNSLLIADKQVHIDNYLKVGKLIIQTSLTIVLLILDYKLLSLAISSLASNVLMSLVTVYRVNKSFPTLTLNLKKFDKITLKYLISKGAWFTLGSIAGILIFRIDAILISKYISLSLVASYAINLKLFQIAEKFHGILFNTTRPYFAQSYGKKEMTTLSKMYNSSYYLSIFFAFFIGITIVIFSKWFISWWVGPNYYLGDKITLFLFVNFIIQATVLPNRVLLVSTIYKVKTHNISRVIDGLSKVIISIILIEDFGIIGIILGSIISSILFSNFILTYLSSKLLEEKVILKFLPIPAVFSFLFVSMFDNPFFKCMNYFLSSVALLLTIYLCLRKMGYVKYLKKLIVKRNF